MIATAAKVAAGLLIFGAVLYWWAEHLDYAPPA